MADVLVVEQAPNHRALAQFVLEQQGGHTVRFAGCATSLLSELERNQPDILLMEAMLPVASMPAGSSDGSAAGATTTGASSGVDLCRQLRRTVSLPILMVSQRADPSDRVMGLRAGADDFLPKPWDPDELLERVNALLRRARRTEVGLSGTTVRAGDFRLNLIDRNVWVKERGPIALTPVECRLLYAMLNKPGALWTREALLQKLWDLPAGQPFNGPANAAEAHVSRLRRKLERNPKRPQYLITVRGEGYQLKVTP